MKFEDKCYIVATKLYILNNHQNIRTERSNIAKNIISRRRFLTKFGKQNNIINWEWYSWYRYIDDTSQIYDICFDILAIYLKYKLLWFNWLHREENKKRLYQGYFCSDNHYKFASTSTQRSKSPKIWPKIGDGTLLLWVKYGQK